MSEFMITNVFYHNSKLIRIISMCVQISSIKLLRGFDFLLLRGDIPEARKLVLNSTALIKELATVLDSSSNVIAPGDTRERKWRGKWRMGWVASTLLTTSEHGVSSITTNSKSWCAHLGCQQSTELTPPPI